MDWIGHGVTRREFVQRVVAASLILRSHASGVVNHGVPIVGSAGRPADPSAHGADKPLIKSLRLLTAAPLAEMRKFYHDLIGFAVTALALPTPSTYFLSCAFGPIQPV